MRTRELFCVFLIWDALQIILDIVGCEGHTGRRKLVKAHCASEAWFNDSPSARRRSCSAINPFFCSMVRPSRFGRVGIFIDGQGAEIGRLKGRSVSGALVRRECRRLQQLCRIFAKLYTLPGGTVLHGGSNPAISNSK